MKAAGEASRAKFGDPTILINNAGIVFNGPITKITTQQAGLTYKVNILAHGITVREFLPSMYRNNKGHVVTIASIAGTCAVPNQMDYNCSKFAAFAFDEGLRGEIRKNKKNVKTLCFCPYFVDTGMFDGAKSKYPLILPILKTDWVCDRIVNAIRQEEKVVITPFIGTAIFMMRYIMPVTAFDYVNEKLGSYDCVDDLINRFNRDNKQQEREGNL